jgi:Periplasmic binding protein
MFPRGPLALAVCALLVMVSCDPSPPEGAGPRRPRSSPTGQGTRVIGLVGTLSGPDSWRGEDLFEGADVAVNALNRLLEPHDRRFELVTLDDRGSRSRATRLVERLAGDSRTVGIAYGGPVAGLGATERALAAAGIPAIACFGDLSDRALPPHVFQAPAPLSWEAGRIVRYLARDRGYVTVGALIERGPAGSAAVAALRTAARRGADPAISLASARYGRAGEEVERALVRLRSRNAEAIVVHGSPALFAQALAALQSQGSAYTTTAAARIASDSNTTPPGRARPWRPQIVGFAGAIAPGTADAAPAGTAAADSLARGSHYLPVTPLEAFEKSYVDWWGEVPLRWERGSYEAVRLLGRAAITGETREDGDLAKTLERLDGRRYGGFDVHFGAGDHVVAERSTIGLWVVPRPGARVLERGELPESLPWVPLARTFSGASGRTRLPAEVWGELFTGEVGPFGRPPKFTQMRFGVTTTKADPVH